MISSWASAQEFLAFPPPRGRRVDGDSARLLQSAIREWLLSGDEFALHKNGLENLMRNAFREDVFNQTDGLRCYRTDDLSEGLKDGLPYVQPGGSSSAVDCCVKAAVAPDLFGPIRCICLRESKRSRVKKLQAKSCESDHNS